MPNDKTPEATPARRLFTVSQFCEAHPWARVGGIRSLLFHRETNGFGKCVRRVGRKILLDETEVLAWVDAQGARQ